MDEPIGDATALIFPGQGSPLDEGAETVAHFAPELAELAAASTGAEPFAVAADSTRFAQPATYCLSVGRWIAAGRPEADCYAGHSLGDLTALAIAGAWTLEDGLRVVCERGRLMAEAGGVDESMLALRAGPEQAAEIAAAAGVVVANDNAPAQQVLSGQRDKLRRAAATASMEGIRSMELPVAAAFHSPAMAGAVDRFSEVLERIPPSRPQALVFSSLTARPFGDIASELAAALVGPVRWRELVGELADRGVGRYVEAGPGRTLGNLVRRTAPGAETAILESPLPAETGTDA
jgi:acyl transferase domain-containing protein